MEEKMANALKGTSTVCFVWKVPTPEGVQALRDFFEFHFTYMQEKSYQWQNNFYSFRDLSNSRWPASPFHWRQRFRTRTPWDSDNLQYWTTYHESDESNPESLGLIRTHQLISIYLGSNLTGSHPHLYLPADWFPLTTICWWFHSGVEEFL